jgi:hypothetical protein
MGRGQGRARARPGRARSRMRREARPGGSVGRDRGGRRGRGQEAARGAPLGARGRAARGGRVGWGEEEEEGRERERERERRGGSPRGSKFRRSASPNPRAPRGRDRGGRERELCAGELNGGKETSGGGRGIGRGRALGACGRTSKLLGPHAPVLVPKTSDGYACAPDNLTGSVRLPQGHRINHLQPRSRD